MPEDIVQLSVAVFGNRAKAELWLNTPISALNDEKPIDRLITEQGVEEVIKVIQKIECREFS